MTMFSFKRSLALLCGALACSISMSALAAYCALRDPVSAMRSLFPESSGFRSIVTTIDSGVRERVGEEIPFSIHFNELGRHTLYVALDETSPLGLVHVRSEASSWGLIEVAWALDLDLRVTSMMFQRCRIPACSENFLNAAVGLLKGKSASEIARLLSVDGESLSPEVNAVPESDRGLLLSVIRSALKTIHVTRLGWDSEVLELKRQSLANGAFGGDRDLALVELAVPAGTVVALERDVGVRTDITRDDVLVFDVTEDGASEGRIVNAGWRYRGTLHQLTWLFDAEGGVIDVDSLGGWPDEEVAQAFMALIGERFADSEDCTTPAQVVAYELAYIARRAAKL